MIVSRRHGIVFIHIWKTGGTSIATALENHLSLRASVGEMLRRRIAARWNVLFRRPVLGKHAYAVDISQRLGAAYEQYFSFAFVRNPWDWLVSWYTFVRRSSASPDTGKPWRHHLAKVVSGMTFDEFIEWVTQSHGLSQAFARRHSSYREIVPTLQRDWVANHAGEIIVDFVGRYERLQADWEVVCKKAALPTLPLPEVNRSREVGEGYRSYYTPETRKAVASYFEADIETFGYRF